MDNNRYHNIKRVTFNSLFLEQSWNWLNDDEIKRLTMTPDITREGQQAWYESLPYRADYLIWGLLSDGTPIGAFGIKNIDSGDGEYWGYIGEKEYWGKGIGKFMLSESINEAKRIGLNRLHLKVARENIRAQHLYLSAGFRIEIENPSISIMSRQL